jgi:hypothetical protein
MPRHTRAHESLGSSPGRLLSGATVTAARASVVRIDSRQNGRIGAVPETSTVTVNDDIIIGAGNASPDDRFAAERCHVVFAQFASGTNGSMLLPIEGVTGAAFRAGRNWSAFERSCKKRVGGAMSMKRYDDASSRHNRRENPYSPDAATVLAGPTGVSGGVRARSPFPDPLRPSRDARSHR